MELTEVTTVTGVDDDPGVEYMDEDDAHSDISDVASQFEDDVNLYALQEVNNVLDETFGKSIDIAAFFP